MRYPLPNVTGDQSLLDDYLEQFLVFPDFSALPSNVVIQLTLSTTDVPRVPRKFDKDVASTVQISFCDNPH